MDITDAAGYINETRDTLIFRALTEASANRLKNVPGITAVNRIIAKDVEQVFFHKLISGTKTTLDRYTFHNKENSSFELLLLYHFYKRILTDYEKVILE
jgi:signal peptidase I